MAEVKDFWDSRWNRLRWTTSDSEEARPVALSADMSPEQADGFSHRRIMSADHQKRTEDHYLACEIKLTKIISKLGLRPQSILDVGAGAGHWSEYCHSNFDITYDRITALDISATALRYVRHRCPGINTRAVELGAGQLQDLGHVDLALAIGVLHHVISFERLVTALEELMSKTDYLIAYPVHLPMLSKKAAEERATKHGHHKSYWTRKDYRNAIRQMSRSARVSECTVGRIRYRGYLTLRSNRD